MDLDNKKRSLEKFRGFLHTPVNKQLKQVEESDPEEYVLGLFQEVSKSVPAYGDFLTKNEINPQQITSLQDFAELPLTNKKNYIQEYPLQ